MKLFGSKEKKSCCRGNYTPETVSQTGTLKKQTGIKILGSGCSKCNELDKNTKEAMAQLGISEPIEHITDFTEIAAYGVMSTPALVIDGKVAAYGKVLKVNEVTALLEKARKLL